MLWLLIAIAALLIVIEKFWPAMDLPKVRAWWPRVLFCNAAQLGILALAGITWDRWLNQSSLVRLQDHMGTIPQGLVAYFVSTLVYYWWHRVRHESQFLWRLCHQLHHSPRRIEILTSFYKHPVEIMLNSILSAAIVYILLGCTVQAGAVYTFLTAVAEFFYHWNISTPRWFGYIVQRPESHRIHHQYRHHTNNFSDLPIWDMLFKTFKNPSRFESTCGYDDWREDRFEDMLAFRDVNSPLAEKLKPLHFLPTCIGCSKRWACQETKSQDTSG